jgi:hypothetical protein
MTISSLLAMLSPVHTTLSTTFPISNRYSSTRKYKAATENDEASQLVANILSPQLALAPEE